jgi:hypothetical protein
MPSRRTGPILLTALLAAACTSPPDDAPAASRFVVLGPAVVRDTKTGFEWTRRDDGVGLDWHKADEHCRSLSTGEAGQWRLPAIEELRTLYGATPTVPCGDAKCAIDRVFTLTTPYVWSASGQDTIARTYLDFQFGTELTPTITPRLVRSVLCVRDRPAASAQ